MQTKQFFLSDQVIVRRSEPQYINALDSLEIPWNDVVSTGWVYEKPMEWGMENTMITRADPEYFAVNGVVRSNIIPTIDVNNPIYHFDRQKYTFKI
jgi:hypothetical protein